MDKGTADHSKRNLILSRFRKQKHQQVHSIPQPSYREDLNFFYGLAIQPSHKPRPISWISLHNSPSTPHPLLVPAQRCLRAHFGKKKRRRQECRPRVTLRVRQPPRRQQVPQHQLTFSSALRRRRHGATLGSRLPPGPVSHDRLRCT